MVSPAVSHWRMKPVPTIDAPPIMIFVRRWRFLLVIVFVVVIVVSLVPDVSDRCLTVMSSSLSVPPCRRRLQPLRIIPFDAELTLNMSRPLAMSASVSRLGWPVTPWLQFALMANRWRWGRGR